MTWERNNKIECIGTFGRKMYVFSTTFLIQTFWIGVVFRKTNVIRPFGTTVGMGYLLLERVCSID